MATSRNHEEAQTTTSDGNSEFLFDRKLKNPGSKINLT